jgi:integrase/recombinase XerD
MAGRLWVPVPSGPLAWYAAGYGSWLVARGYSRWTVAHRLWQLGLLSRWLEREGLGPEELSPERVEAFVAARRAAGYSTWRSVRSTALPLGYLRELGVVPAAAALGVEDGPLDRLLADYSRYLFEERGLCEHTVLVRYVPDARRFLEGTIGCGGVGLERLSAADVSVFLARECPRRSFARATDLVVGVRSLLRWLHVRGLIGAPLAWAVPGVADLRDRSLPRGLEAAVVKALLASCDRRRTVGRRDYAILLLLARLGLRAGEIAAITLDDLDWRAGELLIHNGKGARCERLPLPADIGEAIVSYLQHRPRIESRALFLRVVAPAGAIRSSAVSGIVRCACGRAGLPSVGPHRLRHTVATQMLGAGASLAEIGQVLRHRDPKTTARYAKVDRQSLRTLARPWPWPEGGAA